MLRNRYINTPTSFCESYFEIANSRRRQRRTTKNTSKYQRRRPFLTRERKAELTRKSTKISDDNENSTAGNLKTSLDISTRETSALQSSQLNRPTNLHYSATGLCWFDENTVFDQQDECNAGVLRSVSENYWNKNFGESQGNILKFKIKLQRQIILNLESNSY